MVQEQQVTLNWDSIWVQPSLTMKLYVLFVLTSLVVAAMHFIKSWKDFRASTGEGGQNASLKRRTFSLSRWIWLNALVWGIVTATEIVSSLDRLILLRTFGPALILSFLANLFVPLVLSLWAILALYLVRWHILRRIERI